MSCAEWSLLRRALENRDRWRDEHPSDWRRLSEHLQACSSCRRAAVGLDPTLLFQALPGSRIDDGEVARMRERVHNMRRLAPVLPERRGAWPGLRRLAAVAAVATLALVLESGPPPTPTRSSAPGLSRDSLGEPLDGEVLTREALAGEVVSLAPTVEVLDGDARVYRVDDERYPVVMIVDGSLDVGFAGGD